MSATDKTGPREPQARRLIQRYAIGGIAPGLVPIPLLDAGLILAVQLKMVHHLAGLYGVPFQPERARSLITGLVGGGLSAMSGLTVARLVPGVGVVVGMATVGAMGGATTYAVGLVFMQHFESGGTLLTFDPERVRDHYTGLVEVHAAPDDGPILAEGPRKP